jgi:hypothetical protein
MTIPRTYPEIDAALAAFADELEAAGFRVYRPGPTWHFIGFAREVDGRWLSATVQASDFHNHDGWEWSMNIVPSKEDGSGMFLDDVPNGTALTVETATNVTRPEGWNPVLTQRRRNAGWPSRWSEKEDA